MAVHDEQSQRYANIIDVDYVVDVLTLTIAQHRWLTNKRTELIAKAGRAFQQASGGLDLEIVKSFIQGTRFFL